MKYNKAIWIFAFVFLVSALPLGSSALADSNELYYRLDETSGSVVESLQGQDGVNNGATRGVSGIIDNAFQFDGVDNYVNLSEASFINGADEFAVNLWVNTSVTPTDTRVILQKQDSSEQSFVLTHRTNERIFFQVENSTGDQKEVQGTSLVSDGTWKMITAQYNGTHASLYIDGTHEASLKHSGPVQTSSWTTMLGGQFNLDSIRFFNGSTDEVAFFSSALTQSEIDELYNSGSGKQGPFVDISVTLNSPANGTTFVDSTKDFNATIDPSASVNITNATLHLWYNNGSIVETQTNNVTGISANDTIFTVTDIPLGDFKWNVLGRAENSTGDNFTDWAESNFTFTRGGISEDIGFNSPVLETSDQRFSINVTTSEDSNVQSGILEYNGTNFTSTKNTINDTLYELVNEITIPSGTQGFGTVNRTFLWHLTIVQEDTGQTFQQDSVTNTQQVDELNFGLCGDSLDVPVLNFTMVNEITNVELNASQNLTTFEADFQLGANSENLIKNFSISNQSVEKSRFNFCTDQTSGDIFADMEAEYSATDFITRNYLLSNATLNNNTNLIDLFMLPSEDAIQFFITVTRDLTPLTDANINIQKFFIGQGVYKTIEIDKTDADGKITAYLQLDKKHRFTISKDGEVLGIIEKTSSCEQAPCEIALSITGEGIDPFSGFSTAFAGDVAYNLSYNQDTKIVTFDFVDLTGLATSFRMDVLGGQPNEEDEVINSQTVFTSSGSMTFNATNLTDGEYSVKVYISRSPDKLIDFISFIVSDVAEALGLEGLLAGFILILVVIFGVTLSPQLLVFSVPLSLNVARAAGLVYLPWPALVGLYVLAFISMAMMSR